MAADYVYRNLHTGGYSIMNKGLVMKHAEHVLIQPIDGEVVRFVVRPAGRERVLMEGRKNVHAFVRGEAEPVGISVYGGLDMAALDAMEAATERYGEPVRVTYRPTEGDRFFVEATGEPVESAELVYARSSPAYRSAGLFAWGVR